MTGPTGPGSDRSTIRVAEEHPSCNVLGPGNRYALWVQGCPLRCQECISPQWIPMDGGEDHPVEDVAERVVARARDGLTLSGGDPFAQAQALVDLVDQVRTRRDLSVLAYTGHTLEALRAHGTSAQRALLARLDILVDGPYLPLRHGDLAWRGSDNQRVHLLSGRHGPHEVPDRSVGLQVEVGADGTVHWLGVPAERGFRQRWERLLQGPPTVLEAQ